MSYKKILLRRDNSSNWATLNPVLSNGELAYETNTGKFKIGNGSSAWNSLPYWTGGLSAGTLDDVGDVTITSATNGHFLKWNGSAWVNDAIDLGTDTTGNYMSGVTAGTGVSVSHTPGEGSSATISIGQAVSTTSNVQFNDVTVSGNLTVSGSTTTVNSETLTVNDNVVVLNNNVTGTPTEDAGIEVERGTSTNVQLRWNEASDKWELTNNGSSYSPIATEGHVAAQMSTIDALGDVTITGVSSGQVLKWNGTAWVNATDNAGTTINSIDDIGDVAIAGASNGQVLKWNSTVQQWQNQNDTGFALNQYSLEQIAVDVFFGGTSPSDGDVLTYNNSLSVWQPSAPVGGTVASSPTIHAFALM